MLQFRIAGSQISVMMIDLTKMLYANSGYVNFDHGIKCSSAVIEGNDSGTKSPPSGAYPDISACSKL